MSGLERLVGRVPQDTTPEAFADHLAQVSQDLLDVVRPLAAEEAIHWTRDKARMLGLAPGRLAAHLGRALAQSGSLGPDEAAEYRRNLQALLPGLSTGPGGRPPDLVELFDALCVLGRETVGALRRALDGNDRTVVFLGTDAEFLKISYDLWRGCAGASRAFYLSRISLLSGPEQRILARTRHQVFGTSGVSDHVVGGGQAGRHVAWMDNGLVASHMFLLISHARKRAVAGADAFGELFPLVFREELIHGREQAKRRSQGPLTLFGKACPQADAVIRQGIDEGFFAERCGALARRFRAEMSESENPVIVDIGANGTQPCLLLGVLSSGLVPPPCVVLFTSGRRAWGPDSPAFRSVKATGRFAMAVESMKTYMTNYGGALAGDGRALTVVPPDQQLLAFFKQLAFHRAALEERCRLR
ncbi:hypothetical protein DDE74_32330 [Streptomyces lydicus]|uniref:Uncharacterized protein n=1 Tax=Streptomyces lydicus TaxID=47763 RepID=A0A3Q9KDX2_9ACTN|nr:hypothetical protein [Streptomyces lydicus]AZS74990.1 hypothetical protein DDE74_32330 [Streptomyces lydicus]